MKFQKMGLCIAISNNKKTLFVSKSGHGLLKYSSPDLTFIENLHFDNMYTTIHNIAITKDDKYGFLRCGDRDLVQFSNVEGKLVKKYMIGNIISSVIITKNNMYLFIGCMNGFVTQIDIKTQQIVKKIKINVSRWGFILSMAVTFDNKF